jgi:cell division inhibitor SepF
MSKRVSAEEYEGADGFIAKLRDRWFSDHQEEDEEEEGFGAAPAPATARPARKATGTVLQVHAARGSQITKRVPRSLADAQRAAEDLKERRPVIVNLERADDELARRVIDFISGVAYALNGYYERVGDKVFLFTPSNIVIADEDNVEPGGKGLFTDDDDEE